MADEDAWRPTFVELFKMEGWDTLPYSTSFIISYSSRSTPPSHVIFDRRDKEEDQELMEDVANMFMANVWLESPVQTNEVMQFSSPQFRVILKAQNTKYRVIFLTICWLGAKQHEEAFHDPDITYTPSQLVRREVAGEYVMIGPEDVLDEVEEDFHDAYDLSDDETPNRATQSNGTTQQNGNAQQNGNIQHNRHPQQSGNS